MTDPAVQHLVSVLLDDQRRRYSGGIERFLTSLSTEAGQKSWREWQRDPVTRVFLDALKSLAEIGTAGPATDPTSLALSYGTASGIGLAVRLCEDPTRVFPSIFDGAKALMSRQADTVQETYRTPPHGEQEDSK